MNKRISKPHTHIVFEERQNTKLKNAVKFVKGLPHMCPCGQPNPQGGLVMYMR